jgi:uncharacterized membrane protein YccC
MLSLHRFHLDINAVRRGLSRGRPAWMVSFSIEEASLSEGLRAAFAATAMLLLGRFLHNPLFAWAAIGAFWTCLADAAGSSRRRFASMVGFSVLSTLLGGLTAWASAMGVVAAAVAILVFSSVAGLACIGSAAAYQVAILVATACVVLVDKPLHRMSDAFALLGTYLGGCLFATALSFTIWRIHPFKPSRYAMRLVYFRLAELARDNARLIVCGYSREDEWSRQASDLRMQAHAALDGARKALQYIPRSKSEGNPVYGELSLALADAYRIFDSFVAVADASAGTANKLLHPERAGRCLTSIAEVLLRMGRKLGEMNAKFPDDLRRRIPLLEQRLQSAFGPMPDLHFLATSADPFAVKNSVGGWITLIANASMASTGIRHALRLGMATTAAFLVVRMLHLPFGYWATMATLLILQPSIETTWPRGVERAAGSTAGAALAVVVGFLVHTPLAISLVVFPLTCLTMSLRRVSYSLYVIFLTPTFVLVADFATPANEFAYAIARLGNNVLGCAIALLAAFLLWPTRRTSVASAKEPADPDISDGCSMKPQGR